MQKMRWREGQGTFSLAQAPSWALPVLSAHLLNTGEVPHFSPSHCHQAGPAGGGGRRRAAASPRRHCRASYSASGPPLLPSCTHSAHGGQNELFKAHVLSPQSLLRMPQQLPTAFTQNPKSLRWPGAHVIWPSPTLPPLLCPLPSLATFLPPGPATFLSPGLTTCMSSAWVPVPYLFICYLPPSHLPDFNFISFGQALSPSST